MKTVLCMLQALLFVVSSFAVKDSNFKFWVDRAAISLTSTAEVSFESIEAQSLHVTESEKQRCREWYNANIISADGTDKKPAYDFSVGGKSLQMNTSDWEFAVGEESEVGAVYRGGKTTYITLTHKNSGLVATVEATIYEEYAACEWTVYIENKAEEKSPVISNFYAADCVLPTGKSCVYMSKGSDPAADDFELLKSFLTAIPMTLTANGGRTESVLPYFNISGKNCGTVLAVGWSGQWYTALSQSFGGVKIRVKQEDFKAYLTPGETVRSPLVTLNFYEGENALKGFNTYRNFTIDCVYPEGTKQVTTTGIGVEVAGVTEEQVLQNVKNIPEEWTHSLDYAWVDAGWYPLRNGWGGSVGNWYADPERFPSGLGAISKALEERNMKLLLWYEIERCCKDTEVYNECKKHEGWVIETEGNDDRNLVNLANEDCLEYITDYMLTSLRYNGVMGLRLDCNLTMYDLWSVADEAWSDGRKGITENHYVTNLYRFLDTLRTEIPGLMIDNCASGGKRVDIEMCRRSIPLWRTDYNCMDGEGNSKPDIVEATQAQTYGISFWLPYNGTCAYVEGEYATRTNIISCSQRLEYYDLRPYMAGNYYPLTYGGTDTSRFLAMQFDTDAASGMALIYKREGVKENTYTLKLNGLYADKTYTVYDYDKPETVYEMTGDELMNEGLELTINDSPKAVIAVYNVQ